MLCTDTEHSNISVIQYIRKQLALITQYIPEQLQAIRLRYIPARGQKILVMQFIREQCHNSTKKRGTTEVMPLIFTSLICLASMQHHPCNQDPFGLYQLLEVLQPDLSNQEC